MTYADYLAAVYAEMRQLEQAQVDGSSSTYTTPRTLLSIIRLATALTKLRFDTLVSSALPPVHDRPPGVVEDNSQRGALSGYVKQA